MPNPLADLEKREAFLSVPHELAASLPFLPGGAFLVYFVSGTR